MKIKDLIKKLKEFDPERYVHIQTDKRFEEDILCVVGYETEDSKVIVLTNQVIK